MIRRRHGTEVRLTPDPDPAGLASRREYCGGMAPTLPARARVVIIGGGVIGASVAYHLTRLGLDRRRRARAGASVRWHHLARQRPDRAAAGHRERHPPRPVLGVAVPGPGEPRPGLATGYKACGGVTVARTEDRMTQLRRTAATAEAFGLECELISPDPRQGAVPAPGDEGSSRRAVAAGRRHRQRGRRDRQPGPGRPRPGGDDLRADPCHGDHHGRRRGAGGAHRPRRHRGGDRGQLRRPVGQGRRGHVRRATSRCTRPSTSTS